MILLLCIALVLAVPLAAQTNDAKWDQSVLASQIWMAGAGGAHIAVSSALQPQ